MKKVILLAAMILSVDPLIDPVHAAERGETSCHSTGIADGGYVLTVARDLKSAELAEQTFVGPRNEIQMDCEMLPVRRFPDALNNYLVCRDPRNVDGGLIVRLFSGGIAGLHYGSVRAVTVLKGKVIETEVEYGRLHCQR